MVGQVQKKNDKLFLQSILNKRQNVILSRTGTQYVVRLSRHRRVRLHIPSTLHTTNIFINVMLLLWLSWQPERLHACGTQNETKW